MARTGYLVTVYQDINPSSATYNQTREEREYNTTECPLGQPANWVETTRYCEMEASGAQTGYQIIVYEDVEPTSSTYGTTREERVYNDTDCEVDNSNPDWVNIGDPFCRQKVYLPGGEMANDGYWIQQQQDMNEYSPTADQIRDVETLDLEHCPVPDTTPVYTIISETCHTVASGSGVAFDGTKDVVRIDTNIYSETYNFNIPETVNIPDEENCPASENNPEWSEESYTCEVDGEGTNTGYANVVYKDINPLSETYGTTKTERERDEDRCPQGEKKETKVTVKWRVNNNRSNTTDSVQSFHITFNDGLEIGGGGGMSPGGGYRTGTVQIDASKKTTSFTATAITLAPNGSEPTTFHWTQSPSSYIWASTGGSAILTINLTD